jgi:branched-chain amino acid transport system ATP-binding protein
MTDAVLHINNLSKRFGALAVSDDVELSIAPGEFHALIGPNGAGKTTLIHQITGVLSPDSGAIVFNGADITRLSLHQRARLGLARSFQITAIIGTLTALENVALAVQARSGSSYRFLRPVATERALNEAAMRALEEVGLTARAGAVAGRMSYGEKRSLELAIALALEPKLLVLDEPLAGTGREEGLQLIEILRGLKGRYPILMVEHDMHAVFQLADRVTVMVYGKVIACGPPATVRADPAVRLAYLGEGTA